ncbi:tetratricopeptide repeat protein [Streptomyces sp. NPDC016566]|uniref:tetratricopeptide repeat protein n=1 Tax=Streptomyces sp. NPDC016566 TaxID=3364967 RepID=UPI0037036C08
MSRTPDFFEDLRRVGALKRGLLGGRPSDYALSQTPKPQLSRDTVGAWLRGERFPQRLEPLLDVLRDIRAEAAHQDVLDASADGFSGDSVAKLLAENRWRRTWEAERQRRTHLNQEGVERQQASSSLVDQERRARQAALADRPRPVRSWTPKRLGVHPAIPGQNTTPSGADFVLPTYVRRPHDERLHARLAAAVSDKSSLLVVVCGESCTGKTRTAVEALKAVPDDFQLLFPTDADSLLAMLAADAVGPCTVLWLNEAQYYLEGPAGEAAAAALLRRLDADGPFIALATLWPDHDKTLTTATGNGDPHRQARALLSQAHYVHLPNSFAGHLDAVRHAASHDASLATALKAGGTDVTQVLAAGPDLVAHYERPHGPQGVYGKALLSAAMDAHRLGVTRPLPLAFLQDAAPGYLTGSERAAADPDTWFTSALTHAQSLIKQIIRPLQDVPRSSGMGAVSGVVSLADYLQQHGRRARQLLCPPDTFWNAAIQHLTSPLDLISLGAAARDRYRLRHAAHLYCAAADAGDGYAMTSLAGMRQEVGDREEAERLYRAAIDAGHADALRYLAAMREEAGDQDEAERLACQAAATGDITGLRRLVFAREKAGDEQGVERLLYRATADDAGNTYAMMRLVGMREKAGDREEAERLYRAAVDAGNTYFLTGLALMRKEAGDRREAERLYRAAADAGDWYAATRLVELREEAGDQDDAERLARRAADAGQHYPLIRLVELRDEAGNREEAERLYRAAADAGHAGALRYLAAMREQAGDREEAERLYRAAADAGNSYALIRLVELREKAGDQEGVERLYRAAAGDVFDLMQLVELREEAGDEEGVERVYRAAADAGDSYAVMRLVELREQAGDREEAERLVRQAADAGDTEALRFLAQIREQAGDGEEAERLYHAAAEAGSSYAVMRLVELREQAGDREEAERLVRQAADAGNAYSLTDLAGRYWRHGLDADGAAAGPWVWPEPRPAARGTP